MTIVTDGQLMYEGFHADMVAGTGVILGDGDIPDAAALVTACKYTSTGGRMLSTSLLKTYLKTTLGRNIIFDGAYADVTDVPVKGGYLQFNFSKSAGTPAALLSGTPTWGLLLRPHNVAVTHGQQMLNLSGYFRRWYIFSAGVSGSGADVILPGDGHLDAGQILRLSDIKIPITNIVT